MPISIRAIQRLELGDDTWEVLGEVRSWWGERVASRVIAHGYEYSETVRNMVEARLRQELSIYETAPVEPTDG